MTSHADFLLTLEAERGEALKQGNRERLEALLDPALVHVHTDGSVEGRDAYLATATERLEFIAIEREGMHVHMLGDAAMMTGTLRQRIRVCATGKIVDLQAFVTQIWIAGDGTWRQIGFQATRVN